MTLILLSFLRLFLILLLCTGAVLLFRKLGSLLPQKLSQTRSVQIQLFLLGFCPLLAGLVMGGIVTAFSFLPLPFWLFSIAAVVGWAALSRFWRKKARSAPELILLQNLVPALVLFLLAIQLLGLRRFWTGIPGYLSQEFYLPLLNLASWLTGSQSTHAFVSYCAAFLLLLCASWIGCKWSGIRDTSRLLPWFSCHVGLVLLGLWLLTMSLFTVGTAQYILRDLEEASREYPQYIEDISDLDECYPTGEGAVPSSYRQRPGGIDYRMLYGIVHGNLYIDSASLTNYPDNPYNTSALRGVYFNLLRSQSKNAVLFLDSEKNILHQSGSFLCFKYQTAESWAAGEDTTDGYGWIDLNDETDERFAFMRPLSTGHSPLYWSAVRMTGYFDGSRFEPLSMALASSLDISNMTMARADALGRVQWDVRFDYAADAPADKSLVTIYAHSSYSKSYSDKPVSYRGQTYEGLLSLTQEIAQSYSVDLGSHAFRENNSQYNLFNSVFFGVRTYTDLTDYDYRAGQSTPKLAILMVTAVQASPLLMAMENLLPVYILTAILVLAAFFWLRSLWKNHVFAPLQVVNTGISGGWDHLSAYQYTPPELAELQELVAHYRSTQQRLYSNKNEINRLNTALNFAKTAEENRRQMTSHIAHELKTPLAVIHSYTEGLQERIAEEKREKYLEVILSETERMDAMVLEMLDLSRLEAGRVKLAQDEFSLLALTRSVFDKLDLAVQAKELQVSYECYYDAMVTADESRIRQVVENFATNAVKHTPAGGEIRIHIYTDHKGTVFSMENDGENLPDEVLDKVWDSFWRQDESRSSPGTGLGLAIAKGIITLHGGECAAHNTKRGVEFRFRI